MHLQLLTKDERSDNEEEEDEDGESSLTEDKDGHVKVTNGRHHWRLLSWRLPEETVEDFEVHSGMHEALTPTLGC